MDRNDAVKPRDWVCEDLRDGALKSPKRKWAGTKWAISRYRELKDPLARFLFKRRYPVAFVTGEIESCAGAVRTYMDYRCFAGQLDDKLLYHRGDTCWKLTADIMTGAWWLVSQYLDEPADKLMEKCGNNGWNGLALVGENRPAAASFYTFLSLIYTRGNTTVVGKNKSAGDMDLWELVMGNCGIFGGSIYAGREADQRRMLAEGDLTKRKNSCVLLPFDNPIEDLYLQDWYGHEPIMDTSVEGERDWEYIFDEYSRLILERGLRICRDICPDLSCDESADEILTDLKRQYSM